VDNEIPGMNGLCWSDLPLSPEEIENLQMAGVFTEDDGPGDFWP
jgi:hypothetical protein